VKLPVIPPEGGAFALSQRNLDALPDEARDRWARAITQGSPRSSPALPERLILELLHACNLDCPMCRVGELGVDLDRRMPFDLFCRIADELFDHVREVRLNGLGETTLLPDLDRYLDVLDRRSVRIELITNGTGKLAIYERLVAGGGTVLVSWDAARPDVFERVRRPARFAPLVEAMEELGNIAARLGRRDALHLLYTLQPGTERELPGIVELAHRFGMPSVIANIAKLSAKDWLRRVEAAALEAFAEADRTASRLGVKLSLPDQLGAHRIDLPSAMPSAARGCDRPFKEAVIRWNGDVQVCNMFNPWVYGNVLLGPFERSWKSGFAHAFRTQFRTEPGHPYCKECCYLAGVHERNRT
jgi:radical SAM protein with 4Fe4S-binding SPASM domain